MVDRPDAVLATIPLLAISGVVVSRAVPVVESTVGVGGQLEPVPFTALGLVASLAVVVLAIADPPFDFR